MRLHLYLLSFVAYCFVAHAPARGEAASPEQLARELRIPKVEFRQANVYEAVAFLRKKSEDLLGSDRVLNINYFGPDLGPSNPQRPLVSCSLRDASILETLHSVAYQANLVLGVTDHGLYLFRAGDVPPEAKGFKELKWNSKTIKLPEAASYSRGRKDAFAEAATILERAFGRGTIVPEAKDALDTLRKLSIEESAKEIQ